MRPALSPAQVKAKDKYLRANYHITYEQYCALREFQNYCCAICKKSETVFKCGLAVDHNHKNGQVRGLLCSFCNRKLGRWQDNDEHVRAAGLYVSCGPVFMLFGMIITAPHKVGSAVRAKALAKMDGTPTPKRRKRAKRKSSSGRGKRPIKI